MAPTTTASVSATAVPASVGTSIGARVATTKSKITVTRTATANALRVAWPKRVGATSYVVIASGAAGELASATTRATGATITDLKTTTRYTFIVTPMKGRVALKPMRAVMTRSLAGTAASIEAVTANADSSTNVGTAPVVEPRPTNDSSTDNASNTSSAPVGSPSTPPSKPSKPTTVITWECPTGYVDNGADCLTTLQYTYHSVTTVLQYTFHDVTTTLQHTFHGEFVQTGLQWHGVARNVHGECVSPGREYAEGCGWIEIVGYTKQVKDSTPAGFTDNGSVWTKTETVKDATPAGYADNGTAWTRTEQVRDAAPAGFSDDGQQWTKTAPKVSREITVS